MARKLLFVYISMGLLLLLAGLHTFFILIGGPSFPETADFQQMLKLMDTIDFDIGAGVHRSMQEIMDGFNWIVSVFLVTVPAMTLVLATELRENERAIQKLIWIDLLAIICFTIISGAFLAIGGIVIGILICLLLLFALMMRPHQTA